MTDYAHNQHAAKDRYAKAERIAQWCWDNGATAEHLMQMSPREHAALGRLATGRTASDETVHLAYCLLEVKTAWAAAHPGHPKAARTVRPFADITAALTPRRNRT